jgi:hypothetical protein
VRRLLHEPTLRLRTLGDRDESLRHVESLRYLFGLGEADDGLAPVAPSDRLHAFADANASRGPRCVEALDVAATQPLRSKGTSRCERDTRIQPLTAMLNCRVAWAPDWSMARALNANVPARTGVPEMPPELLRESPGGSWPATVDQL